ncbi:ArsR/SmtB family transcription factor [Leifsonia sp. NPDC058248]|uniref:ArsR/SmtB family transcription factor n=1 Tax=Leifsonia sp. NPDC058248 TaxID=3346402 RepID=UPI0036D7A010
MDALEAIGDPVRRRFVELLGAGDLTAGELAVRASAEFGISQPAASRHLRILRETGLVTSAVDGKQRVYALDRERLDAAASWFDGVLGFWSQRLDALETELVRGRRRARVDETGEPPASVSGEEAS